MPRPFAADDYAAIRARMVALRQAKTDADVPAVKLSRILANPNTPPSVRRFLERRGFKPA